VTITRGRIVRESELGKVEVVTLPVRGGVQGRRVPKDVVEASDRARRIVENAEERARMLLEAAARNAGDVRLRAESEGRADGVAQIAETALRLARHEASSDERNLDRSIELATILSERMLGRALELDPGVAAALARQALSEARGARRVRIFAHPEDAAAIERARDSLGLPENAVVILSDAERKRGDLRLETEIGVLDAALAPSLERLAHKLREAMKK
jgi:flagellar biosynthesis/type III secretory pathway protein FliH